MSHSPAPWKWDEHQEDDCHPELVAANGDCIMHFGGDSEFAYEDEERGMMPQNPADAALICAAPDLLEACKDVVGSICEVDDDGNTPHYDLIQKVKAAIDKAEGK